MAVSSSIWSRPQEFAVDSATGIAKVGAGVQVGNLALDIYDQGRRALPPWNLAGIGGHLTHDGYDYSSRWWGLSLDIIVAFDAVLADGNSARATNPSYPDICSVSLMSPAGSVRLPASQLTEPRHGMARRGTADIFGIVTTFYVQTQPPPAAVINFAFDILAALASKETAADAFLQVLTFALNASAIDRRLGFGIYVDQTAFLIRVTFFGSVDELSSRAVSSSAGSPEGMVHIPRVISTD
ncbi:MAG: hypothetical protein M1815_005106 [Lichina confinis]|nr:MAG: hypothetical protein M1815_005106 [Lichina confinis]